MALTVSRFSDWKPDELARSVTSFNKMAETVRAQTVKFTGATDLSLAWQGRAGAAAIKDAVRVGKDLHGQHDFLVSIAAATSKAQADISAAQKDFANALKTFHEAASHAKLNDDGSVKLAPFQPSSAASTDPTIEKAERLKFDDSSAKATRAAMLIRDAMHRATQADAAFAFALEAASNTKQDKVDPNWVIVQANLTKNGGKPSPNVIRAYDLMRLAFSTSASSYLKGLAQSLQDGTASLGSLSPLKSFYEALNAMSPDELTEFFSTMPPALAAQWRNSIDHPDSELTKDEADAQSAAMQRLTTTIPVVAWSVASNVLPLLQPSLDGMGDNHMLYQEDFTPLFHEKGPQIQYSKDINQGGSGDCYLLADLVSLAQLHPEEIQKNITQNSNGSYTVRFFKDGVPVDVTVSGSLPVASDQNYESSYAAPAFAQTTAQVSWVAIYEKAYAKFRGNYKAISDGGYIHETMSELTGPDVKVAFSDNALPVAEISKHLESGSIVTVASNGDFSQKHEGWADPAERLPSGHAYAIVDADIEANTVTVQNPWGDGSSAPKFVTLTYAEYSKFFDYSAVGDFPPR